MADRQENRNCLNPTVLSPLPRSSQERVPENTRPQGFLPGHGFYAMTRLPWDLWHTDLDTGSRAYVLTGYPARVSQVE
jgi:hypothetical protein